MAMHSLNGKCVFRDRSLELQRDPKFLADLVGKIYRTSLSQTGKHVRERERDRAALATVLNRLPTDDMPRC